MGRMGRRERRSDRGAAAGGAERREGKLQLRIIGGRLRGRGLAAPGSTRTRPMMDRVREAVFNLVGRAVEGKQALDLFAGSGALGLEALSRGAQQAVFLERHFPTARLIRENLRSLQLESSATVVAADTFSWFERQPPPSLPPWLVFCSPPYDFYLEREQQMLNLLQAIVARAADGSLLVVECDARFEVGRLPAELEWDVRTYGTAVIAVAEVRKTAPAP